VDPQTLLDAKNFSKVHTKSEPKSMTDIEKNLWKNNVKSGR
jgi:hypothetical protein